MLACGDQTLRAENPAQVAGFISEWWPASNRNRGRIEIGISGRIESEFARTTLFKQSRRLRYPSGAFRPWGRPTNDPKIFALSAITFYDMFCVRKM